MNGLDVTIITGMSGAGRSSAADVLEDVYKKTNKRDGYVSLEAAWKFDQQVATDMDMARAKLKATEMLAMVADEALQIHGGMGLMADLPLERIWRDARIERIWEGTSEIQRHIISRSMLRPLGG